MNTEYNIKWKEHNTTNTAILTNIRFYTIESWKVQNILKRNQQIVVVRISLFNQNFITQIKITWIENYYEFLNAQTILYDLV